jgi:hypothetical protein
MIWFLTIVIFFATLVAVMLVYWSFLQRKRILAALSRPEEHRLETRIQTKVGLQVSCSDEPLLYEITFTENVSPHGARILSKRRWSPNDSVLVKLPQEGGPSSARITYCQPLSGDEFATGLQFSFLVYEWMSS